MSNVFTFLKWFFFPYRTDFTAEQIPDLTGRVVIVTGGNEGIGKETVKALLDRNARVYIASRSKAKADAAIQQLHQLTGKQAIFLELDLASLSSVRRSAEEFLSKEPELHVLYNNAGVMWPAMEETTEEGFDLQFGVNVLGHFLFTELLVPALAAGAASSPDQHSRVITVASSASLLNTVNFDTLKDGPVRRQHSTESLYNQSKFLNVVVARETAKRYADKHILSIPVHPGNIKTELMRTKAQWLRDLVGATLLWPAAQGALTQLWAGTMPEAIQYNAELLVAFVHVDKCRAEAYDPVLGERVWSYLQEQVARA
ncbi:NAD(P)-binding protein [Cristinia sonorae]|uniref:NAD(P)-binding protein n=1 Tax=Cristinia sonorae TaxID=1940300 RepID=A0A8K0XL77_9AGAR|nr:NAD(P)-binding protein [Cristinia sonorae]